MTEDERRAREEIRVLMARYNIAGDRGDLGELAATFTDDGEMHSSRGVYRGRDQIVRGLGVVFGTDSPTSARPTFCRHNLSTSLVRFESPGIAIGRTYFSVITPLGLDHAGVYVDRISKESGEWLFKRREIRVDYVHEQSQMASSRRAP